jgi:hypothetical protein
MARILPKIPLFSKELRSLTEEEIEDQKVTELIRDDDDIEFEERLARATRPVKDASQVDLPSFLQNTNAN